MINEEKKRKTSNNEFGKWKADSARVRAKNNIGRNTRAWSGRPEVDRCASPPSLDRFSGCVLVIEIAAGSRREDDHRGLAQRSLGGLVARCGSETIEDKTTSVSHHYI